MDAEGARELARRIGSNTSVVPRPLPADGPSDLLPLYRWFGGGGGGATAARITEPSPPAKRPSLRRLRFRGR